MGEGLGGEHLAGLRCPPSHMAKGWWARQDLNLRATGYEPGALPLSYGPRRQILTALLREILMRAKIALRLRSYVDTDPG